VIGIAFGVGFLIGPAYLGFLPAIRLSDPSFAAAALSATSIFRDVFSAARASRRQLSDPKGAIQPDPPAAACPAPMGEYGATFAIPALGDQAVAISRLLRGLRDVSAGFPLFASAASALAWRALRT